MQCLFKWQSKDPLSEVFRKKEQYIFIKSYFCELWYLFSVAINKMRTSSSVHAEVCKHLDCSAVGFNFGLKGGMTEPGNFLI